MLFLWIFGKDYLSVFVTPEAVQIGQNIDNSFALELINKKQLRVWYLNQ